MARHIIVRGNNKSITVAVVDGDAVALNLDGLSLRFLAKESYADADADAVITKSSGSGITHASPQDTAANTGLATIAIVPSDTTGLDAGITTILVYELRLINGTTVTTLEQGTLTIGRDVVRAVA